jgi:hypothetical protein
MSNIFWEFIVPSAGVFLIAAGGTLLIAFAFNKGWNGGRNSLRREAITGVEVQDIIGTRWHVKATLVRGEEQPK